MPQPFINYNFYFYNIGHRPNPCPKHGHWIGLEYTCGATTFSITTLSILTFSIVTLRIKTFSITTLRMKGLFVTLSINDKLHA
jgi:hypothetical protein